MHDIPLKVRKHEGHLISLLLFSIVLEDLASETGKERK